MREEEGERPGGLYFIVGLDLEFAVQSGVGFVNAREHLDTHHGQLGVS